MPNDRSFGNAACRSQWHADANRPDQDRLLRLAIPALARGQRELARWAGRLAEWTATGLDAYVYFNNDVEAHAIRDAERLRDLVVAQSSTKNGSSP